MKNFNELARNVINIEQQAIAELLQYIDNNFELACQLMYNCKGRVIVIGMGKSGHIGGKIALSTQGKYLFFPPARYAKICTAERFTTKRRHAK